MGRHQPIGTSARSTRMLRHLPWIVVVLRAYAITIGGMAGNPGST
jgi:hypothetical protein